MIGGSILGELTMVCVGVSVDIFHPNIVRFKCCRCNEVWLLVDPILLIVAIPAQVIL